MKIKVDHVTNSSSEVFGVVLADSAVVASLMFMLDTVVTGINASAPLKKTDTMPEEMFNEAERAASRVTEGVLSDAREQEKIIKDAYTEALGTLNKASSAISNAMSKAQKDWETYAKTADKTSAEYQQKQQTLNEGLAYLKTQLKQLDLQKAEVEKEKKEASRLINERDAWIQQNQSDYVTLQEQKALLDSLSSSIKSKDGEENPWLDCYKELEKREADIDKALSGVNARIDYKAIARGELKPNPETVELLKQFEEVKRAFETESAAADESTKKKLRTTFEKKASSIKEAILKANRVALATKASEGLQYGADVAVDGLAELAGPAGAQLKIAYNAIKTLAAGYKDAKKDPKNRSKHLAKAILNVSLNTVKDQLGDIPYAKDATTILNNVLQSSLSASIAGTSTAEAVGTSLTKGLFDVGSDKAITALKKATTVEVNTEEAKATVIMPLEILNDNPLTSKLSQSIQTKLIFE